ncbi:MAG: glycine--tRNA ligase [Candidatus Buchananbacteria bacterium CG10_big_fil_rev_8_21_14_0_10_42_9]|uniref:Glycine--tRNA ligase n=1 Tax=Candidatus Buchananbacteria bacterium CG10_big_fil_rev_8_21_14_0_10_42_9 TaxID=1974526 RepID=A0A2H0W393_9BACT|nr:MAG: glycine--tRNA ligase [Candidatus Buchananbacteria bacterium CG10_big_fil_rev_8_21_14_0_10_42_9]
MKKKTDDSVLNKVLTLAKQRGFIFPSSEIYGGLANTWDYGPLGVELKNNIKQQWWVRFVHNRTDMVGLDAAILMNPKTWEASGHISHFNDPLVECKKTHKRYRADHLLEDNGVDTTGMNLEDMQKALDKKKIKSPDGGELTKLKTFNMMLESHLGPIKSDDNKVYFRPETAQAIFVDFNSILNSARKRVPFGVAQIGKAFRNEITPGNFIFRTREFEQMEIEYFVHPKQWKKAFDMWLKEIKDWLDYCGVSKKNLVFREIKDGERAHYSKRTVDIEYKYPFGTKELYGLAYRTDYDLAQHAKFSGQELVYTDPETQEKYVPHVIEPSLGVDRTLLVMLLEAYDQEEVPTADGKKEMRTVLRLPHVFAPYKIAVLPLSKKLELRKVAEPIWRDLTKQWFTNYDETQAIGRRYRRQDEIGTPYCVTIDFETLEDKKVTVRDRDTMKQDRVAIAELIDYFKDKFND